jgi:hypothetical protein
VGQNPSNPGIRREFKVSDNYWSRTLGQRINRRRALVATSGGALGEPLAACGGDRGSETKRPGKKGPSGLLYNRSIPPSRQSRVVLTRAL